MKKKENVNTEIKLTIIHEQDLYEVLQELIEKITLLEQENNSLNDIINRQNIY